MRSLTEAMGWLVRGRMFSAHQDQCESDLLEYLHQREEIALRSLQDSLKDLEKYRVESTGSQSCLKLLN